jgi:hypothetical protein
MLQQRRPQRHQAQLKFLKRIGGSHQTPISSEVKRTMAKDTTHQ